LPDFINTFEFKMMITKTTNPQVTKWMMTALGGASLMMASPSQAAVIVTFEQVGSDVVATWNGTLDLGAGTVYPWLIGTAARSSAQELFSGFNGAVDQWRDGTATITSLATASINLRTPVNAEWGFSGTDFTLGEGMKAPGLTMVDFGSGSTYTLTWSNTTLSAIGAASFNNTLAWTSGGGDTISYTTVPEPGGALLLGVLGMMGFFTRRRA
jgi:hypothetical protein